MSQTDDDLWPDDLWPAQPSSPAQPGADARDEARSRRRRTAALATVAVGAAAIAAVIVLVVHGLTGSALPNPSASGPRFLGPGQSARGLPGLGPGTGAVAEAFVAGRVTAVSATSITISAAAQSVTAAITKATQVAGRIGSIGQIKVGDHVSAQVIEKNGGRPTVAAIQDPAQSNGPGAP